jgi:hypothetical protein
MANTHKFLHLVSLGFGLALPAPALAAGPAAAVVSASASAATLGYPESGAGASREASEDEGPPLLFGRNLSVGAYAGMDVAYSRMFGQDGAVVGLQGALVLDHRLSLGLAGYGWTNSQQGPTDSAGNAQSFDTGYGGVTLRYSFYKENFPIYVSVGALVGGGAIALTRDDQNDFDDTSHSEDVFALLQPDVTLSANLTRWMRLGVTAGYRLSSGVDRNGYDESDVNGLVLGGNIQFGRF